MTNIENKCFIGDSIDSTMDTPAANMMHELLGTKPQKSNIEKLIERMGWQPIETCPDTGVVELFSEHIYKIKRAIGYKHGNEFYILNSNQNTEGSEIIQWNPTYWKHISTGKEGEVIRVLWEALKSVAHRPIGGDTETYFCAVNIQNTAKEALSKAEELAGEV